MYNKFTHRIILPLICYLRNKYNETFTTCSGLRGLPIEEVAIAHSCLNFDNLIFLSFPQFVETRHSKLIFILHISTFHNKHYRGLKFVENQEYGQSFMQ